MIKTIGAFAPSDPVNEQRLARLRTVERSFAARGMRIKYGSHALQISSDRVPAELRASDFADLMTMPDIDALVSICGGKRCDELLPLIDFAAMSLTPKPVYGFSNACILLNAWTVKTGLVSYYGPESLNRFALSSRLIDIFIGAAIAPADLCSADALTVTAGQAQGTLFGGNLSSFVTGILGTQFEPTSHEVIFFWESGADDSEYLTTLLRRLLSSTFRQRIAAMLIGQIGESRTTMAVIEPLLPILRDFQIPTLFLPVFGHFRAVNAVLPIGRDARLDTSGGRVAII